MHRTWARPAAIWATALLVLAFVACGPDGPTRPPSFPDTLGEQALALFQSQLTTDVAPLGDDFLVVTSGVDRQISSALADGVELDALLQVLDAKTLSVVGTVRLPGQPMDVVVVDTTAYVAAGDSGLLVVDLALPEAPMLVQSVPTQSYARTLAVSGDLLVAGAGTGFLEDMEPAGWPRLLVLDISMDLRKPVLIGSILAHGPVSDLTAGEDGWVYTAEWDAGVGAYDVRALAEAGKEIELHFETLDGKVDGVAVHGDHIYAALVGGSYINKAGEIRVFSKKSGSSAPIATEGFDLWIRTVVPQDDGSVFYVGVGPTGSEIGVAAPGWDMDPVVLADFHEGWQFAIDMVQSGDELRAIVVQPTGTLDLGAGGCALRIEELDSTLRTYRVN